MLKCCRAKIWTFPGKIPVNMTKQSMHQMKSEDWLVTSKANGKSRFNYLSYFWGIIINCILIGTRYLLFIYQQKAYFINRKLDFFHAPQVNVLSHQLYSIIDGEMVIEAADERDSDVSSSALRFLVHDALYLDGKYVGGLTLVDRMQRVKTTVNKISNDKGHEYPAIFVSTKKYHPIYQLKHVINASKTMGWSSLTSMANTSSARMNLRSNGSHSISARLTMWLKIEQYCQTRKVAKRSGSNCLFKRARNSCKATNIL